MDFTVTWSDTWAKTARPLLTPDLRVNEIDGIISSILRDATFTTAWRDANNRMTMTIEDLTSLVVPAEFQALVGGYHDELQAVASALADVVRDLLASRPRPEIEKLWPDRLSLPSYLDDDDLPIEVWEAVLSRDIATVSYLALIGHAGASPSAAVTHLAELHCRHQRRWLDLLSWMFDVPCPPIIRTKERQPWVTFFEEHEAAEGGLKAILRYAEERPNETFVVTDRWEPSIGFVRQFTTS
jgi:hypothetical protein